jgi:signal transduction histidine kinase/DNA-binding response OmpR family regulator
VNEPALVLVVDDDDATRETIAEVLSSAGMSTVTAGSAGEAMELVYQCQPALAVLDHRLPDGRGTDLVAGLKEFDPRMPVLLVTGYASLETAMSAVGQFDEYLVKPVPPARLLSAVRAALERRRLLEENATLLDQLREANDRLATEMAVREQELAGLVAFALAVAEKESLIETIEAALQILVDELGLSPVAIYVVADESDGELLLVGCRGEDWEPPLSIAAPDSGIAKADLGSPAAAMSVVRINAGGGLAAALLVSESTHSVEFMRAVVAQLGLAIGNAQRLEQESESVRRLTELGRLRASLIGGVSHELRTPLTAMMGLAQTLRMRELPPEMQTEFLDQILRQAGRLKNLVGDLLDETRLETGIVQVDCRPVALASLLHEVAASFVGIDQTLSVECDSAVHLVSADRQRLEQVFVNLVHNATKYAPSGSVIRLRANAFQSQVTVAVSDDGPGVAPAFLPRIFDAFSQGDSSDTRRDSGLGLGLAIARGFAEAMGGTITAESRVGQGATFVVHLNVADRTTPSRIGEVAIPGPRADVADEPSTSR